VKTASEGSVLIDFDPGNSWFDELYVKWHYQNGPPFVAAHLERYLLDASSLFHTESSAKKTERQNALLWKHFSQPKAEWRPEDG
jgi:hypothetical protein